MQWLLLQLSLLLKGWRNEANGSVQSSLWSDVETKTVDKLPFDIDGLVKYQLIFDKERRMESSQDGRPWAGFMMSRRSGFTGTHRLARCKGSYKCINDDCTYLKQYFKRNKVQFQVRSGENICHSCGAPPYIFNVHLRNLELQQIN